MKRALRPEYRVPLLDRGYVQVPGLLLLIFGGIASGYLLPDAWKANDAVVLLCIGAVIAGPFIAFHWDRHDRARRKCPECGERIRPQLGAATQVWTGSRMVRDPNPFMPRPYSRYNCSGVAVTAQWRGDLECPACGHRESGEWYT